MVCAEHRESDQELPKIFDEHAVHGIELPAEPALQKFIGIVFHYEGSRADASFAAWASKLP
jgi:hypothetical protein